MVEANDFRIRLLERGGQERTGSKSWIESEKIINATVVPKVSCSETRQKMATHISSQCPSHAFLPHLWMWLCEVHT